MSKEKAKVHINNVSKMISLKKHSSHHAFIPDWMHDCVEWGDCNILFEKIEQKNK